MGSITLLAMWQLSGDYLGGDARHEHLPGLLRGLPVSGLGNRFTSEMTTNARIELGLGGGLGRGSAEDSHMLKFVDPTSERALSSAQAMRSPYLNYYLKALKTGLAAELMPDPFGVFAGDTHQSQSASFVYPLPGHSFKTKSVPSGALPAVHSAAVLAPPLLDKKKFIVPNRNRTNRHSCVYKTNVDYIGIDVLTIPYSNLEKCCQACRDLNIKFKTEDTCAVAVLSSSSDDPPRACWLKRMITKAVPKAGVTSCIATTSKILKD